MSNLNNLSKIELQLILKNHVDSFKKTELIEMIKNLNLHKSDADNHKAFIDEAKAKIIKSKISREKDIKKVASLIVQPKIKPKTNTNENAWVKHLQYIKSIEDVTHQQAMKMAKDSKNKYFYNPNPKEVVKQKKEKKVNTCGICEKVFFDKSGLNRHMQLHKIELSKIRGLIKRQEFFLKNNNVMFIPMVNIHFSNQILSWCSGITRITKQRSKCCCITCLTHRFSSIRFHGG